jgi:hypothetical protein
MSTWSPIGLTTCQSAANGELDAHSTPGRPSLVGCSGLSGCCAPTTHMLGGARDLKGRLARALRKPQRVTVRVVNIELARRLRRQTLAATTGVTATVGTDACR